MARTAYTYLTNALGEDCGHIGAADFDNLGLAKGSWEGQFYPLTTPELGFIASDDEMVVFPSGQLAFMGYTVLYKGEKCALPTVEYWWPTEAEDKVGNLNTKTAALRDLRIDRRALELKVQTQLGGKVVVIRNAEEDRHQLSLILPFSRIIERFPNYPKYVEWLKAS